MLTGYPGDALEAHSKRDVVEGTVPLSEVVSTRAAFLNYPTDFERKGNRECMVHQAPNREGRRALFLAIGLSNGRRRTRRSGLY